MIFSRISENPDLVSELKKHFILFRTDSEDILGRLQVKNIPSFVILDPFMEKIYKPFTASRFSVEKYYKKALGTFTENAPDWTENIAKAILENYSRMKRNDSTLVVLVFLRKDGKNSARTLSVLSDKTFVGLRHKLLFVKEDFDTCHSDVKSKWSAKGEGSFVIIRPAENEDKYKISKIFERAPAAYELGKYFYSMIDLINSDKNKNNNK
ncbi:MAG: hypothetical protein HY606_09275 [Planctomycetes bacterium]|nr:hypothetical protein [Planctomycetota bacterium]